MSAGETADEDVCSFATESGFYTRFLGLSAALGYGQRCPPAAGVERRNRDVAGRVGSCARRPRFGRFAGPFGFVPGRIVGPGTASNDA